jgi:hypothetical protein
MANRIEACRGRFVGSSGSVSCVAAIVGIAWLHFGR